MEVIEGPGVRGVQVVGWRVGGGGGGEDHEGGADRLRDTITGCG